MAGGVPLAFMQDFFVSHIFFVEGWEYFKQHFILSPNWPKLNSPSFLVGCGTFEQLFILNLNLTEYQISMFDVGEETNPQVPSRLCHLCTVILQYLVVYHNFMLL